MVLSQRLALELDTFRITYFLVINTFPLASSAGGHEQFEAVPTIYLLCSLHYLRLTFRLSLQEV